MIAAQVHKPFRRIAPHPDADITSQKLYKLKHRYNLGLTGSLVFWMWMSTFIWAVEIEGNYSISDDVFMDFLTSTSPFFTSAPTATCGTPARVTILTICPSSSAIRSEPDSFPVFSCPPAAPSSSAPVSTCLSMKKRSIRERKRKNFSLPLWGKRFFFG